MEKMSYDAPDSEVVLSDKSTKLLSSFWQQRPLALVFPRFFGCPFGRRQILQLCHEQNALGDAGIDVVLVSSGTCEQAEFFRRDYKVPFTIICDPDRALFKKYDLREMSFRDYLSPRMHAKTIHVLAQGSAINLAKGPSPSSVVCSLLTLPVRCDSLALPLTPPTIRLRRTSSKQPQPSMRTRC